jgi:hypothetical protein
MVSSGFPTHVVLHVRDHAVELHQLRFHLRNQTLTEETAQEELAVGIAVLLDLVVEFSDQREPQECGDFLGVEIPRLHVDLELASDVFLDELAGFAGDDVESFGDELFVMREVFVVGRLEAVGGD